MNCEDDTYPVKVIESIVNGRNGNPTPWNDTEIAIVERASIEERLEPRWIRSISDSVMDESERLARGYFEGKVKI